MKKIIIFTCCFILFIIGGYSWIQESLASRNVLKVVALGDSITHGTGDPDKKGYIERVKLALQKDKGISVKLRNFGIPKYTTEDILKQLENEDTNKQIKQADMIILYVGTNDFRHSAKHQFENIDVMSLNRGRVQFSKNLDKILHSIRNQNQDASIFVLGLYHPYVEYKNNIQLQELIYAWNDEIHEVIKGYEQVKYVPTLDLFNNKPKTQYFSDSIHPNPAGYELIANRLLESIQEKP
ncbi:GDSL-type esterase/lipase family protein [Bacillus dakarensis]|uniref:GDSL-type esterase/lipase family protein n=1 Tax=Robertmurraya dakarensis TaxID=1926278 RepID=UPI000981DE1A|nr:GDSL-type esterase/lipase family protein [Bacillus dakarensis]